MITKAQNIENMRELARLEQHGFAFDISDTYYSVSYKGRLIKSGNITVPNTRHWKDRAADKRDNVAKALAEAKASQHYASVAA